MRKVTILDPGDTRFLEQQIIDKQEFMEENDRIWGKKVVVESGDSQTMKPGQIVTARKLRDENSALKRKDLRPVEVVTLYLLHRNRFCKVLRVRHYRLPALCRRIVPGNDKGS